MQPGSRYAISSSELITAINDGAIERIVLRAGIYEFADSMCSDTNVGDSALCINRTVTIEAEVAGSVVLDAKGTKRVIAVLSGAVAKLVGLNITGGAVVSTTLFDQDPALFDQDPDLASYSLRMSLELSVLYCHR